MTMAGKVSVAAIYVALVGAMASLGCEGEARRAASPDSEFHDPEPAEVNHLLSFSFPDSVVGELIYVPVYSSVFNRVGDREYFLTATLSIHNIHLTKPIRLSEVNYYNTHGQRIRELVHDPISLGPLETKQFVIPRTDQTGGTGANFIVKWEAAHQTPSPVIEALMISTSSQQGISFVTQGSLMHRLTQPSTRTSSVPGMPPARNDGTSPDAP